jgi:hypothetical protein
MTSRIFKLTCLLIFTCCFQNVEAQDLTGIWRGYFVTDGGENYKLEFQIGQNPTRAVTGVSYSYLDKRFYGKATMTGRYTNGVKVLQIQELRTVEVRNLGGGGTCIMNYKLQYSKSGKEEYLEGTYLGKSENIKDPEQNGVWGDCGTGKVFLRRVAASDFYVEPFLKNTPKQQAPPVVKTQPKVNTTPKNPPVVKKDPPVVTRQPKRDSIVKRPDVVVTEQPKKIVPKFQSIPRQTRARENDLVKTVNVSSNQITVKLYDNGEIDDDTITVYMDEQVVLSKKRLSATPLTLTIKMDGENSEHVLIMVAENLGRIPPNTSLMIVNDGDKRHEVRITSTEQKNAMVRFRYEKD